MPDPLFHSAGNGLRVFTPADKLVRFAASIDGTVGRPQGDLKLRLSIPYDQVPYVMPVLKEIGGILFEVTIRRVPFDELPGPGW